MVKFPHWPISHGTNTVKLGLARVLELLARLDNPHKKLPPVLHVAGTNGKGSTIIYLHAIFEIAGYSVHRYTSPHLIRFNERIVLAGNEMDDSYLQEVIEECRKAADGMQLTFFEGTTVAAFLAFSRVQADVVLLETGMGGRLDATNVIEAPLLSIITPIAYDHMEYLGSTLAQIAREKAGIIKSGCGCVIGWQYQEVRQILKEYCDSISAWYYSWNDHWEFYKSMNGFCFCDANEIVELPLPSLAGIHQIMNAAVAVAAIRMLKGYNISTQHIQHGLQKARWPARLQKIEHGVLSKMLPKNVELWLDGAHNPNGAEMLVASLLAMPNADVPLYIISGRTKDRDIAGFLQHFVNKIEMLCAVEVQYEPLSEKAENIHKVATQLGFRSIICDSLTEAVQNCLNDAAGLEARIVICGSLYLAGDVLAANGE